MKRIFLFLLMAMATGSVALAQYTRSLSEDIHTVRVLAGGDVLQPPVLPLGRGRFNVSFDRMGHDYTRYIYKVQLCNADWTVADEVFESDYMSGFNNQPIEDYETSFNTTQLYTHYSLDFPNENCRLLLPGNYRVSIFEEDEDEPVAEACFCLYSQQMNVTASVSSNTDIDVNKSHQQVSVALNYGALKVVDPRRELHTVVLQNRRWDNAVTDVAPNIQKASGAEWTHRRELIFPAGNEYHKCEILDVHRAGMGVDRIGWYEPYFHATLFASERARNYTDEGDTNGIFVVRHSGDEDNDTQSEYLIVHFPFKADYIPGGQMYVCGLWDNGSPDPRCRMTYDEATGTYEAAVLLKQGYYSYQYRFYPDEGGAGDTQLTDGNYYETENEYLVLVYHRAQGARYDALVAMTRVKS